MLTKSLNHPVEYLYYDFLAYLFTLKYLLKQYTINNGYLLITSSYSEFIAYYQIASYKLRKNAKTEIEYITKESLLNHLFFYCMYQVDTTKEDYQIILKEIKGLYHPIEITKLASWEQEAFFGQENEAMLLKKK